MPWVSSTRIHPWAPIFKKGTWLCHERLCPNITFRMFGIIDVYMNGGVNGLLVDIGRVCGSLNAI
jgi:hypothetical protein